VALALGIGAALVAAARRLDVVEVRGSSMSPTLMPGDRLIVVRTRRARPGLVVLAADPRDGSRELVKRVSAVSDAGVTITGDNPAASTDGRAFGAIPAEAVRWRVALRYWPPRRIGRVARRAPGVRR
jgi:nickel-type superoxide dismutase maturation protease